jgi:L-ascorbate metabolism protein UlaG (beta-lactamase superfamily)
MEFQYFGGNCVRISTKQASVVVDDNLADLGLKSITKAGDIALFTGAHGKPEVDTKIVISQPGEYEVSHVSMQGFPVRAHIDEDGKETATMYKLVAEDIKVLIAGHIYPELSDKELEDVGLIDVMIVPVGGNGYTLDGVGALKVIKKVEPKVVIPVHYADKTVNYPVPQQELEQVLQALAMEPKETTTKLKIKSTDLLDGTQLIILGRQ